MPQGSAHAEPRRSKVVHKVCFPLEVPLHSPLTDPWGRIKFFFYPIEGEITSLVLLDNYNI